MNERCPEEERLLLYAAGELPEEESAAVAEHLEACESCRESLSFLTSMTEALKTAASAPAGAPIPDTAQARWGGCPGPEELAGYADGTLTGKKLGEVEHHLAHCGACLTEVADLRSMAGNGVLDAPESAVRAVLTRLDRDSRTAVVHRTGRAMELVRDFASRVAEAAVGAALTPAPATAASRAAGREIRLEWSGDGGSRFEAVVAASEEEATLTGRVTVRGRPSPAVSVSMTTDDGAAGPESPDAAGRFGPWAVSSGENVVRVTGLPEGGGDTTEFIVLVTPTEPEDD